MASIRTRELKKGGASHTVTWRDPESGLKSRTFDDKALAQELKDFLDSNGNSFKLAAKAKVRKDSTSATVAELVEWHIDRLRKPQPGTIAKYRRMMAHIAGSDLGNMPVDKVKKADVLAWFDGLTVLQGANQEVGRPLSYKTKRNVQALLSAAFRSGAEDDAMDTRYEVTRNPAKGISDADEGEAREPVYLSPEDLDMLADEVDPHYALFIRVLSKSGLRYSEATALRKRDLRIEKGRCVLLVTRAWKATDSGEAIGPPKTKKARRNVTLGAALSNDLIQHIESLRPDDLVFTRPSGEYLRNSKFHKEVWQPLVSRLVDEGKLDRKPWVHEIRHAHATHLLQAGRPVQAVQARLGHEDPQTTLRVYARLSSMDDLQNADALG